MESFGRLFKNNLKLYIYPLADAAGSLTTVLNLDVAPELRKLYGYLADRGSFVELGNYQPEYLKIFSRDVLKKIAAGDNAWEEMVPEGVSSLIRKRHFFGCQD